MADRGLRLGTGARRRRHTSQEALDEGRVDILHPSTARLRGDYCADGTIDRIVDYGEAADESPRLMVIYYASFAYNQPGVIATTTRMATTDYEYVQDLNQWQSEFRGNGSIYMFSYSHGHRTLMPFNEAPFCFYDLDGDGMSEIAVRLEIPSQFSWVRSRLRAARFLFDRLRTYGNIATVRYSLNLEDGQNWDAPYRYDFSVTGVGRLVPNASATTRFRFRRIVTQPVVACDRARGTIEDAEWQSLALTWNEDDLNYAEDDPDQRDRWEGVINRGSAQFLQVGGPPSRRFNKRTEIAPQPGRRMQLYFSEIDRRIHLHGAKVGHLRIDYDQDGKMDMQIRYEDTDGDGVFDRWEVDVDGDGTYDRVYVAPDARAIPLDWDYDRLAAFYRDRRRNTIAEYQDAIATIKAVIGRGDDLPVERYYFGKLWQQDRTARRFQRSQEARRFYLGVIMELYFHELKKWLSDAKRPRADIEEIERVFGAGRYRELASVLAKVSGR